MKIMTFFLVFVLGVSVQAGIVIDDFSTTQVLAPGEDGFVTGGGILGGERDISTSSQFSVNINSIVPGQFIGKNNSTSSNSIVSISYDGIDGSSERNYGGLGHLDLTGGGQYNGFALSFTDFDISLGFVVHL